MEKSHTIELASEELQDILGKAPSFIVKWGMSFILAVILIMLLLTSFFSYPETEVSKIVIYNLNKNKPSAKVVLPVNGVGRIAVGQKVMISIDNYPSGQFGTLSGRIIRVCDTPVVGSAGLFYTGYVFLDHGLISSSGKNLSYFTEMHGTAEIVTGRARLIDKLFFHHN